MSRLSFACVAAILAFCPVAASHGHHSFAAEFDRNKPIELTGTVTKVEWTNPHARIYIDVQDEDGKVVNWDFELGPPNGLMRQGWNRNSLQQGPRREDQRLLVEGSRARRERALGVPARRPAGVRGLVVRRRLRRRRAARAIGRQAMATTAALRSTHDAASFVRRPRSARGRDRRRGVLAYVLRPVSRGHRRQNSDHSPPCRRLRGLARDLHHAGGARRDRPRRCAHEARPLRHRLWRARDRRRAAHRLCQICRRVRAGEVVAAQAQLLGPLLDMLVFAPLFAAAIYYRRKPELHKRLMIVATTSLLIAAVGRMPFLGTPRDPLLLHLIWTAPILLAMAHDFWRQRSVHPVYVLGLVVLVLEGPLVRAPARGSETWQNMAGWLARGCRSDAVSWLVVASLLLAGVAAAQELT